MRGIFVCLCVLILCCIVVVLALTGVTVVVCVLFQVVEVIFAVASRNLVNLVVELLIVVYGSSIGGAVRHTLNYPTTIIQFSINPANISCRLLRLYPL